MVTYLHILLSNTCKMTFLVFIYFSDPTQIFLIEYNIVVTLWLNKLIRPARFFVFRITGMTRTFASTQFKRYQWFCVRRILKKESHNCHRIVLASMSHGLSRRLNWTQISVAVSVFHFHIKTLTNCPTIRILFAQLAQSFIYLWIFRYKWPTWIDE